MPGVEPVSASEGIAAPIAAWAAGLRHEDVPEAVRERARLQAASVLAAVIAGAESDLGARLRRAARRWGTGEEARLVPTGERVPVHTACYVNAACSVALDFDDYLFAGHTGHSSVLGALAVGEATGATGRDVLVAQVAGNELGGRLGAAFLLGPHNGQMWAYVHALAGAVVAGRLLGLDAVAMRHAIGIALAAPPYPLAPAFFGPDSKALVASGPLVEGVRAAELAAEGLTGAEDVLGGPDGMLARMATRPLPGAFTGLGDAWVTASLAYKLFPGCAYLDTPVEALLEIREAFAAKAGRPLAVGDVEGIRVEATLFTDGMERMSAPYRRRERITPVDVTFSVALSFGVLVACGELSPRTVDPASLARHREAILAVADRVEVTQTPEMNAALGDLAEGGVDPARLLAGGDLSLEGVDLSRLAMRFPARVTLRTTGGEELAAEVTVPAGAPGRPAEEVRAGVREKFLRAARGVLPDPEAALARVLSLDEAPSAAAVVAAVVGG
jgi:2-methylcitrate dehydratase PrpD